MKKRRSYKSRRIGNSTGQRFATYEVNWRNADDNEIAGFVDYHYRAAKQRRASWEAQAAQQLAWARGNQNLVWDVTMRDLVDRVGGVHVDEITQPVAINILRSFIEQQIGLNFSRPVTWESKPRTEDDADIAGAKLGTQLLQYYWSTGPEHAMVKLLEGLWMMHATGIVFIRITWDPFAGRRENFGPDYSPGDDEPTRLMKEGKFKQAMAGKLQRTPEELLWQPDGSINLPEGELSIEFPSGFDISEPVHCRTIDRNTPWIIHSRYMQVETVRSRYGEKAADITPDMSADEYYYRSREAYGNLSDYSSDSAYEESLDEVLVHTLWRPQSEILEKGYYAVVCNDTCLVRGDNPYKHGHIPIVRMCEMPDPEHFRPGCKIRDLMGPQAARNARRGRMYSYEDKCTDPRMFAEEGAKLPEDAFTGGAKIITVADKALAAGKIKPVEMPPLPPVVITMDQMDRQDMYDIAGIHRSTMGAAEGADQSGVHASILQNADMRGAVSTRTLIQNALGKAGGLSLSVIHQFARPARTISILGERGESLALTFSGEQLRPSDEDWSAPENVIVTLGVEPDQEIELDKIERLTQLQYLRPDRDADRLLVMKWLGERVTGGTDDYSEHRINAARENRRLLKGELVQVAMGDADDVHIEEHMRFTTLDDYKAAAAEDPKILDVMLKHVLEHYLSRADKLARPEAILEQTKTALKQEMNNAVPGHKAATPGTVIGGGAPGVPASVPPAPMPLPGMAAA